MAVMISEKAAGEIKRVISEQKFPEGTLLRVGIAAGGCSGFQYNLGFDTTVDPASDHVSEQHGLQVAVDKKSALYLDGTTIDFYEGLERRGFTFNNPNVQKSCGCGSILDGNCESNADEETLVCRIQNACHDTHDFSLCRHQRSAGVSRIHGGIELDQIRQQALSFRRVKLPPQAGHHARRYRRTDAKRKTDGKHVISRCKVRSGAHGSRKKIVGNCLRLKHC